MLTRRQVIAMGAATPVWAGLSRLLAYAPGQFWNERPAAEWSEKEVAQLLSHSPWAKEAEAQFKMPGGDGSQSGGPGEGMGGGMGGPPGGGGPGGGMGGPPGGGGMGGPPGGGGGMGGPPGGGGMGGPGGGMPQMKAAVRWESATPVVEAQKKQPDPAAAQNYIISVSGLPLFGGPPPGRRDDASAEGERRPGRPAPTAEQRKAMIGSLKQSSVLQRKGKDPIAADRVGELEGSETPTLLFYFPRTGEPISLADKEVTFITRIGPLQLKVKFAIKEMQYHGQVSL
jgi:hypothetical protein